MSAVMPDVYRERDVVARRTHACCECSAEIAIGERYRRSNGLWDGRWSEYKTCSRCSDLRERVRAAFLAEYSQEELPAFGELDEWLSETGLTRESPELVMRADADEIEEA